MSNPTLGIIGGGQLGSLLSIAAKKLDIETVILSDDNEAPAKNFNKNFIYGNYEDQKIINEFINKVDLVTFEFENIPFKVLKNINEHKTVLPNPDINKLIQNRYYEKDFLNKNDIRTTRYELIKDEDEIKNNSWINLKEQMDLLFEKDTEDKWKSAIKRTGIDFSKFLNFSGSA